ncbi:MAG: putative nucleoside-diphosphate sugar epimerase [Microvirga sp.]|jgi:FlaA1/EpsC-like NDP-sugar epimerase|nr:putative nucleoside-diphosphate sugar epimerase [Microvirga sp.]
MRTAHEAPLSSIATGRTHALFDADLSSNRESIEARVKGRRVLCIGAAGSIGSSTTALLADLEPAALHLIDHNENELTELVRSFRARSCASTVFDFRALALDYGANTMRLFLHSEEPYDLVLNFAAIKHVRAEKDAFSVLQMFDTNIVKQARLLRWLAERRFAGRYFAVSTDKAANPSSMMGATKRVMEHVMFDQDIAPLGAAAITSARFANVAFSNGSLLQSFANRLARREPLAVPSMTRRYFVSLEESGQICLAAATLPPHGVILIPRLDPREHLVSLQDVAERFLRRNGFEPACYVDESAAKSAVEEEHAAGRWPLLLTPLDTSGEKPYEEFVGEGESIIEIGLPNLLAVRYKPAPPGSVARLITFVASLLDNDRPIVRDVTKEKLKDLIADVEPNFAQTHRETGRTLDQRL